MPEPGNGSTQNGDVPQKKKKKSKKGEEGEEEQEQAQELSPIEQGTLEVINNDQYIDQLFLLNGHLNQLIGLSSARFINPDIYVMYCLTSVR